MQMNKLLFCGVMLTLGFLTPIVSQAALTVCLGLGEECPNGAFGWTSDNADTPPSSSPAVTRNEQYADVPGSEVARIDKLRFPQNLESFRLRWGQPYYESAGLVRWRSGFADINAVLDDTGTRIVVMDVNK